MLVFLVGFMGSGKTTTGERLARRLNYNFIDLDQLIEEKNKKSIPLIFKENGEVFFRQLEMEILHECFSLNNTVISSGGGTPCFYDNMAQMKHAGLTIYLKLAAGSLFHRVAPGKAKRPLIAELTDLKVMEFIVSELEKRKTFYEQADIIVKGENLKMEELADLIKNGIEKKIHHDQNPKTDSPI